MWPGSGLAPAPRSPRPRPGRGSRPRRPARGSGSPIASSHSAAECALARPACRATPGLLRPGPADVAKPDRDPVGVLGLRGRGERVAERLERRQQRRRGLHGSQCGAGRQRPAVQPGDGSEQVVVVVLARGGEPGAAPVAGTGRERVLERVTPVLPGEAGAVRGGALVAVDPDAARPGAAGPHQRHRERPGGRHQAARRAAVQHARRYARPGRYWPTARPVVGCTGAAARAPPARRPGLDDRVGQVVDDPPRPPPRCPPRRRSAPASPAGRAGPRPARTRRPGCARPAARAAPHRRRPERRTRPPPRARLGQHAGGELVLLRPAQRQPEVGQVRVHLQVAVPGPVRHRAGRGDALPGQRHQQVPRDRAQRQPGRPPRRRRWPAAGGRRRRPAGSRARWSRRRTTRSPGVSSV